MKNFEDYKSNNRDNNMKVAPKNKLKIDIENKIEEIKSKDKVIGLIVDVLFKCCKVSSHEKFLLDHMEDESNYYRTYINTQKAKTRGVLESLSMIKINNLEDLMIKFTKNGNRDFSAFKRANLFNRLFIISIFTFKYSFYIFYIYFPHTYL